MAVATAACVCSRVNVQGARNGGACNGLATGAAVALPSGGRDVAPVRSQQRFRPRPQPHVSVAAHTHPHHHRIISAAGRHRHVCCSPTHAPNSTPKWASGASTCCRAASARRCSRRQTTSTLCARSAAGAATSSRYVCVQRLPLLLLCLKICIAAAALLSPQPSCAPQPCVQVQYPSGDTTLCMMPAKFNRKVGVVLRCRAAIALPPVRPPAMFSTHTGQHEGMHGTDARASPPSPAPNGLKPNNSCG